MFPILALAARKDRDDQLLGLLWDGGLGHYLNSPVAKTYELSYGFLSLICTGSQGSLTSSSNRANSKSPPPESTKSGKSLSDWRPQKIHLGGVRTTWKAMLRITFTLLFYITGNICVNNLKSVLSTPLGVAVIATCIHNLSILQQIDDAKVKVYIIHLHATRCLL